MSLRVVFMGTPDFAVPVLEAIVAAGHEVCGVLSQPPSRRGRGKKELPSPVHLCAEACGIEVFTPKTLKNDAGHKLVADLSADVGVVVAYGQILSRAVLEAPKHGCFNVHASLLPRWRGAAPIHRAIMAGDSQTGVSIMQMDEGLDTGAVCLEKTVAIDDRTTTARLHDVLALLGAEAMVDVLTRLEEAALDCKPQPEVGVTYAHKIDKGEARIDFSAPSKAVLRHIHGLSPFPGAFVDALIDGREARLKLLEVEEVDVAGVPGTVVGDDFSICCGKGGVRPIRLQRQGKQAMDVRDFLRGAKDIELVLDREGGGQ